MIKQIVANCLVILCFSSCVGHSKEKAFLAQYEYEDFSQFNSTSTFIRGLDSERNPIVMIDAATLVEDTVDVGLYTVTLDKNSNQIIRSRWTLTEDVVNVDTMMLQQLAISFIQYNISRLIVDDQGNVFVYLKDVENPSLARFINENELQKHNGESMWINIRHDWYIPR